MVLRLVLLMGAALGGRSARAEEVEEHVSVHWNAPPACPSEAALKRAIESHLGQSLGVIREQPLAISANVVAQGPVYAARLRFESPSGTEERALDHPECSRLLDAAALVIALAIDPARVGARRLPPVSAAAESPPPASDSAPQPAASGVPDGSEATSPPPARGARSSRDTAPTPRRQAAGAPFEYPISVSALVGAGGLPGIGGGVGVGFALSRGHFELGVSGRYWLPRSRGVPGAQSAEISIAWLTVDLRACGGAWLGAWGIRTCAAAGGGDIWGRGVGMGDPHTRHTAVPTLSAGAFLSHGHGAASPFVGLTGDWLLVRPRLGVTQDMDIVKVYESFPLAVSAVLGVAYLL